MVQLSNLYLQRGAAKILNKALLKFGCKPKGPFNDVSKTCFKEFMIHISIHIPIFYNKLAMEIPHDPIIKKGITKITIGLAQIIIQFIGMYHPWISQVLLTEQNIKYTYTTSRLYCGQEHSTVLYICVHHNHNVLIVL